MLARGFKEIETSKNGDVAFGYESDDNIEQYAMISAEFDFENLRLDNNFAVK